MKETKTSEEETLGKDAENVSTVNQNEAKGGDTVEKDRKLVDQKDTSGEVEEVEPCESCKKVFAFHKELKDNMCDKCIVIIAQEEHIVLPNKSQCEECTSKFTTKTLFKKHKHCRFDESYLRFVCDICIEMWTAEEPFEQHMHQKQEKQIRKGELEQALQSKA